MFLTNGQQFNIIEVEREKRSLSILILSSIINHDWKSIYNKVLVSLVNNSGTWSRKSLNSIENQGIRVVKAKHSSKEVRHKAEILFSKLV